MVPEFDLRKMLALGAKRRQVSILFLMVDSCPNLSPIRHRGHRRWLLFPKDLPLIVDIDLLQDLVGPVRFEQGVGICGPVICDELIDKIYLS